MMKRLVALWGVGFLIIAQPVNAIVRDTFPLVDVFSDGLQGNPGNDLRFESSEAQSAYILKSITWNGNARAGENPGVPGSFPTWGQELSVRITHDQSGNDANFQLGSGVTIGPDLVPFDGRQFSLFGTVVNPNDTFTFEFFENLFDDFLGGDAIWDDITFEFDDIEASPIEPVQAGFVRVDATGRDSWPSNVLLGTGEEVINFADFWGIEYAAGSQGPSITRVDITLSEDGSMYFNPDQFFGQPFPGEILGINQGITLTFDDEGVQLSDSFATATLVFEPGDFGPGDRIRFGVDVDAFGFAQDDKEGFIDLNDNLFGGQLPSGVLPELSENIQVTVTFDDEQSVTGTLADLALGGIEDGRQDVTALVDLAVPAPAGAGRSAPEPASVGLVLVAVASFALMRWPIGKRRTCRS